MTGQRARAPRVDGVINRERLISCGRRIFAEQGPDAPLEAVAQAASVSRTTLYRHFRTREELAAAVLEENVASIEARAAELRGHTRGIVDLFDFVLDQQRDNGALVQVLARSDLTPLIPLSHRTVAAFEPLLEEGLRQGVVHPDVQIRDVMIAFPMAAEAIVDAARTGDVMDQRVRAMLHRALWVADS